jgi:hypothetical protein
MRVDAVRAMRVSVLWIAAPMMLMACQRNLDTDEPGMQREYELREPGTETVPPAAPPLPETEPTMPATDEPAEDMPPPLPREPMEPIEEPRQFPEQDIGPVPPRPLQSPPGPMPPSPVPGEEDVLEEPGSPPGR